MPNLNFTRKLEKSLEDKVETSLFCLLLKRNNKNKLLFTLCMHFLVFYTKQYEYKKGQFSP